ncbi:MAG: hypothetical protein VKJ05_03105 [Synechococcaceae cyanobacterium]|nr:hypothetical protein [Synechococcaceae cyanobacterium]
MPVAPPDRPSVLQEHPWWPYVPPASRGRRRRELALARLRAALLQRRVAIVLALLFYGGLCLLPLAIGQPVLTAFALLPLLLVPPVVYMAYLIAWHEFHR